MPISIRDRQLASAYANLEAQRRSNPSLKIDDTSVLKLMAAVGDRFFSWSDRVLKQLEQPGLTVQQKVDLVKKGLTADEKTDLEQILDSGEIPLELSARNFVELVVGRTPTQPPPQPPPPSNNKDLSVKTGPGGVISGQAKAGDSIEAINISAAPTGRLHMDDTVVIAKADGTGAFTNAHLTGDQAVREGDLIRMRVRHQDGSTGDWLTVKATGVESKDSRNAEVAVFRIGLSDAGSGQVAVTNINASRQVSEPGAVLQLTNTRTGEKTKVTITEEGGFPEGFKVGGKPGDVFSVAASDGANNTDFATEVGKLTVPGGNANTTDLIEDPKLHKDELNADGTPKFSTKRFTGPLFKDGVKPSDVQQGQIGDCYLPAAMAALAQTHADAIENMIRDNGDGTYTVTFQERDWSTNGYRPVEIPVDGDLYVRSWGGPLYGSSAGDKGEKSMELWFPLVEKAYAAWKGSYDTIGNGGHAGSLFEAVLGERSRTTGISASGGASVWAALTSAIDQGNPVAAGTFGSDRESLYTNSGVYADHAYSVLGYEEKNGQKYVTLRNPWGESEPAGNGANDGVFQLKLEEFTKLYQTLMYV